MGDYVTHEHIPRSLRIHLLNILTFSPQIDFESEAQNALAVVTLPPTLLHNLSNSLMERVSRINFLFFTKTGLFQVSMNTISFFFNCCTVHFSMKKFCGIL